MRPARIVNPVSGEQVVGVSPPLEPRVVDWNRRLNLFPGRALSDIGLTSEQNGRAGRLTTRAQVLSSGVVFGLEVGLDREAGTPDVYFVQLSAGLGLTASGEEAFVPLGARVAVRDLPVSAPATLLAGQPAGATLGTLIDAGIALPQAGILVLKPVTVEIAGEFDPDDQCVQDPADDPYDDQQLVDAVSLVFYAWPEATLALPAFDAQWRNRLAWAIFESEATRSAGEVAPWEELGLPVALMGFDATWTPLFTDRAAVARHGGKARRRSIPIPGGTGNALLDQARIEQLSEQLTDPALQGAPVNDVAAQFRFLPPVGLLPRTAVTFASSGLSRAAKTPFFPGSYVADVAPAPLEQLDAVVKATASLAPFDLQSTDRVRILVPVPQMWFEPNLLQIEQVDAEFQQTIDRFANARGIWLNRRADLRGKASALNQSLEGKALNFVVPDPDALEADEAVADGQIDEADPRFRLPEDAYGVSDGNVTSLQELRNQLSAMPGVRDELTAAGVDVLSSLGLRRFISEVLEPKVRRSDDRIDLGFLRVQTDIYRHRQVMLGNSAATRLATSESMATIAQSATAATLKEDLSAFLAASKTKPETVLSAADVTRVSRAVPTAPDTSLPTRFPSQLSELALRDNAIFNARVTTPRTGLSFNARELPSIRFAGAAGVEIPSAAFFSNAIADTALASQATNLIFADSTPVRAALFNTSNITQQSPAIGASEDFRTVTIAERLKPAPSMEARAFTVASKADVISSFLDKDTVSIGDLPVPGLRGPNQEALTFSRIDQATVGRILAGEFDRVPDNSDEAAFFATGVRTMDTVIQLLRLMEGRVQTYRRAVTLCNATIAAVYDLQNKALTRLQVVANGLAEARHDVSVARALLAEETSRVDGINARRNQIINEQVKFVFYFRPRTADNARSFPYRAIDPAVSEATVPACLRQELNAPPELRAMVNVLRESPVGWFRHVSPIFRRFDRLDQVLGVLQLSKRRASFADLQLAAPLAMSQSGPLASAIARTFTAQQDVIAQRRLFTTQVDLSPYASLSWQNIHQSAIAIVSLGDLIDAGHVRADASRQAAQELENIYRVAACLYVHFSAVLPAIRLNWAERASQYDGPLDFRDLNSLPRWGSIDVLDRKEMQITVEWLFGRIDTNQPQAVTLMNDLVRVALLLASHAPVNQIVAGAIPKRTTVKVGGIFQIAVNVSQVRVGMHALVYANNQVAARAVVEDLGGGMASARVIQSSASTVNFEQGAVAHFAEAATFDARAGMLLR
ncbi:MAG: hypothetical protein SGI92_05310 [Bryobacteraceae bacterium]|nr:hypothetical protein [Bryobacteraceae bacterium]